MNFSEIEFKKDYLYIDEVIELIERHRAVHGTEKFIYDPAFRVFSSGVPTVGKCSICNKAMAMTISFQQIGNDYPICGCCRFCDKCISSKIKTLHDISSKIKTLHDTREVWALLDFSNHTHRMIDSGAGFRVCRDCGGLE